jgi:leader peptidase (prepilin peptidase)/N-methyltransferase
VDDALGNLTALLRSDPYWLGAACAALGLMVGSFLNVVVHRLPRMLEAGWRAQCAELEGRAPVPAARFDLVVPRSRCPSCEHPIRWYENVPVVSWLALRGRCSACRAPIALRYPLVELASGLLALACAMRFGWSPALAAALLLSWALLALALIDLDHQLLPDDITLPMLWLGMAASLVPVMVTPRQAIVGAVVGYLSLWTVFHLFKALTGKEGFGYGDFKLLAMLGAWCGAQAILPVVLLASLVGAAVGLGLVAAGRASFGKPIAFGVFLCPAAWVYLIWGERWVARYLGG